MFAESVAWPMTPGMISLLSGRGIVGRIDAVVLRGCEQDTAMTLVASFRHRQVSRGKLLTQLQAVHDFLNVNLIWSLVHQLKHLCLMHAHDHLPAPSIIRPLSPFS